MTSLRQPFTPIRQSTQHSTQHSTHRFRSETREPASLQAHSLRKHRDSWGCNPSSFVLNLTLNRRDVALFGHFCAELRQHHLKLSGAFTDPQATELLQLLHRINNHLIAGQLPNTPDGARHSG